MCLQCIDAWNDWDSVRRAHTLQLLALVEQPDALPADAALRLAREILALVGMDGPGLRCDAVLPPEADIADTADRGLS